MLSGGDGANDWSVFDDLIGRIYESALDPRLWDDTLTRVTAVLSPLEWDVAFLIWERASPPAARFVGATGLAPGISEIYSAVFAANNPWSRRIASLRCGTLADTDEMMSREELVASPLYRDFLVRWGLNRALAVLLDRRGGERLALVLPGPADRDLGPLKRGLRVLAPHIQRAVRISNRIAVAELRADAAVTAADRAVSAILCLRPDLSIVTANRHVARYEANGVISLAGGRLGFVDPTSQRQLLALARSAPPAAAAFATMDAAGRPVAAVGARTPVQTARALGGTVEGAGLIVSIGGGAEPRAIEISRVAAWFGLTPSEARLAAALAAGSSLQHYCAARNVSIGAGRFLLKGVFRKTDVASQAQLVALVSRLPE
jgi:DNA-binding CsgD family transcriptional regulator